MEDRLQQFLEENAPLSGTSSFSPLSSVPNSSIPQSIQIQSFPPSPCFVSSSANERAFDFCPLQCLSDGATRFIHHQIVEIASGWNFFARKKLCMSIFSYFYFLMLLQIA